MTALSLGKRLPGERSSRQGKDLQRINGENLTITVCAAGWAGNVTRLLAATIRAGRQLWSTPTVRAAAHFLLHLGGSTLWNGHGIWWLEKVIRKIRSACLKGRRGPPSDYLLAGWAGSLRHLPPPCPLPNSVNRSNIHILHPHRSSGDGLESP